MFETVSVRRKERAQTSPAKVIEALFAGSQLTLALKDQPCPYAVTVNYAPLLMDDELYLIFHGAKAGRKYELLRRCPQAGFTVTLQSYVHNTGDCKSSTFYQSVCGEGTVSFLQGKQAVQALVALLQHLGSSLPAEVLGSRIEPGMGAVQCFALKVSRAALKEHRRSPMAQ